MLKLKVETVIFASIYTTEGVSYYDICITYNYAFRA